MPPSKPLPYSSHFPTAQAYVSSLLSFSSDPLFKTLCGGVHILDFFTRDSLTPPIDLYHSVLPTEWISFFSTQDINSILDHLLRTPIAQLSPTCPESLAEFISNVRVHSLSREFVRLGAVKQKPGNKDGETWALNAGMRPKKIHEVENFSTFVNDLVGDVKQMDGVGVTHVLDFGAGQAYLSRTLAKRYGHRVVGIESRAANIEGAKEMDERFDTLAKKRERKRGKKNTVHDDERVIPDEAGRGAGSLQYIEKRIEGGDMSEIVDAIKDMAPAWCSKGECRDVPPPGRGLLDKNLLLISLHSCGNLVHHALTSFLSTPSVKAVALIGCCYNLMTEKHGVTYKPPLRDLHPRLAATSNTPDPHGFPLSNRFTAQPVALNITARMMACQAPHNWTTETSSAFFTRHYFRALLQRMFYDRGLVHPDQPVIIGSLRKKCYESFSDYVAGAVGKLEWEGKMETTKEEVEGYERRFESRKKDLSVLWSLMAFCAGVVESLIVVDRWTYLMEGVENRELKDAWVEAAFEYGLSPRNLVVVGVR